MGRQLDDILAGNTKKDIYVDFPPASIAVTNLGSTFLHFPQIVGAQGWVPPRTYNAMLKAPRTSRGTINVDSTAVPSTAYPLDQSDLTAAQITVYEDDYPASPGISLLPLLGNPTPISGQVGILGTASVAVVNTPFEQLIGQSGALLGDSTTATLVADTNTDTIITNTSPNTANAVMASFKPANQTTLPKLVSAGALLRQGLTNSITPQFGQGTTAGNFLEAKVRMGIGGAVISTTSPGWSLVVQISPGYGLAIFQKPNCGANEAAPTFTVPAGNAGEAYAEVAEYSGVLAAAPLDQTGSGGPSTAAITITNGGADAQFGDLIIFASAWAMFSSATATWTDVFNNGATATPLVNSGGTARLSHVNFIYGIVPFPKSTSPLLTRTEKKVTYTAVYRLAARPYALSNAFAAAGRKQYATIHHPNTSTKTVKLRHVYVAIESQSVAAIVMADLVRITTAPVTGNPAITPTASISNDPAVDSTCLALPTTAGTEGGVWSTTEWNLGATAAASVVNPPPPLVWQDLVQLAGSEPDNEGKLPIIRPSTLEGWAVTIDDGGITTVKGYVIIIFTEE